MAAENGINTSDIEVPLKELESINEQINVIVDQLVDEEAQLHAKYELKKAPLYKQRQTVIDKIPNFWLTCFERHPVIASLIELDDAEAISYLKSVEIDRVPENPINYKISFVFAAENPFFTNKVLSKEFDFSDKENIKVTNTKINWKEGKDLVSAAAAAAAATANSNKEKSEDNYSDEEDEEASFFVWFNDENGSALADMIVNDIFPQATAYFNDTLDMSDEDGDMSVFDELGNMVGGGGGDDDDDDDDSKDEEPASKRAKRN